MLLSTTQCQTFASNDCLVTIRKLGKVLVEVAGGDYLLVELRVEGAESDNVLLRGLVLTSQEVSSAISELAW